MRSPKRPARPYVVNWTAWGTFAAALMPLAQVSPPLRLFALIALFFGGMFFLYALKYYVSMALILIANGNGNGNGNGAAGSLFNGNGNGHGLRSLGRNGEHQDRLPHKPFISIHLPLYNEASVVDRLLQSCTNLNYEDYEVVVADDSSDETITILDQRWAPHPRVKISRRHDRSGFKGGALEKALEITDPRAEFIAVFDADFIPPPDILQQFLAYFYGVNGNSNGDEEEESADYPQLVDDRLAVVQGYQWHILNASENWITRGIRTEFSGSYVIERSSQELLGAMKMISGSVFMIRADVLRQHGWGTSITEDWELTLRLYLSGYKVLYTPFIQAPSECVATFKQLARQRMRWAEGHTFNVKKYFLDVLASPNINLTEKLEFIYYAPYYLQSVFFIIGTLAWLMSEVVLRLRLPMVPATIGWALVFTNALSLVLMNLTGLFMERGVRRNWSGLLSFILLTYLLVPYQAYAALKGLLEPHEGGWHRTQKTGIITDVVDKLGLGKRMKKLLPKQRRSRKKKSGGVDIGKRLGGLPVSQITRRVPAPVRKRFLSLSPGLRLASGLAAVLLLIGMGIVVISDSRFAPDLAAAAVFVPIFAALATERRRIGTRVTSVVVSVLLALTLLALQVAPVVAAPDAVYLHDNSLADGLDMDSAQGTGAASLSFNSIGQTAHWYTSQSYPTGTDDANLSAGSHTLNMYFGAVPGGGASVDLTVGVYHTRPDGSDPQLITSTTTSINAATPSLLVLDLGSGSAETFTQSDPRRLRLTVTVDDIVLGGSFTLNYDSAADPTSLETPSLTVLDPALVLAFVAVFIPIVAALVTQRRKLASRVISLALAIIIALALLSTQVQVVTAAPDAFYLHPTAVNDGEQLTNLIGSGASTLTFDTLNQTARWYTELDYPAGGDDATIAAGSYTFNLYFTQLPGGGWWDASYDYRTPITVSTGAAAVTAGYSVSLSFDHAQLVTDNKAKSDGDDLRVVHFDGANWTELDRVVDIHSGWDQTNTKIWFQLQDPIGANNSDASYYLYYGNPPAASPPNDPAAVFAVADAFDNGSFTLDLEASTAIAGSAVEDPGFNEAILDAPSDADAAILFINSALPFDRKFAIRHRTKLESGNGETTLMGVIEDSFDPAVTDSSTEDDRRRIMVTHDGSSDPGGVYIFYVDGSDTRWYWDGATWTTTLSSATLWNLNDSHTLQLLSDGTQWSIELRSYWGTLLDTTDPVLWSDVQDLGDDFWFYWGDPYTDQYSIYQSSDWLSMREYVDPEPTSALGSEQTPGSTYVDVTISAYHSDSDGNNPTPIVSQATTIDAVTANPLVLGLGSATEQTFSSANPQKLGVEIKVDDLAAGADFVLAYDSEAQPSRLETPSLTVLDPALILTLAAILIPIITALMTERRKMATRLISVIISVLLALALLSTQVAPVVAAPDSFYLHDDDTGGVSPAGEYMNTDAPTDPAPPAEFPAGPNYRSIGTNAGTLYSIGNASIDAGTTTVNFGGGASLPGPTAVGAVGVGDKLVIGSETFFILSRDSDAQVTVQNAAASTHTNEAYTITRAYNSFQAWEDPCGATPCLPTSSGGRGGDLVGEGRVELGVAYKDGVFAPTSTTTINGSTTDASNYMGLTVAVGQRHSGVAGTGVIVDGGSIASSHLFHVRDGSFRLQWLEIRNYPGDTVGGNPINVQEGEASGTYLSHLIIHDYTDNVRGAINIYDDTTVRNTILYNGANGIRTFGSDVPQVTLENLTIYNMSGDGVRAQAAGTLWIKNNISVGSGGQDFDIDDSGVVIDPSSGYNLYEDVQSSVHPGSNNQSAPASLEDLFVSIVGGSENLHLEPGGHAAIDNGVSLAASFTVDIDSQPRPYRAAWDIGADERLPYQRFDTVGQDIYWYSDVTYPTGNDSGSIAAGDYTLNLYFAKLPAAGASVSITVSVARVQSDGTPVDTIVSTSTTIDSNTANPLALALGSGAAQTFDSGADERLQVQIHVDSIGSGGSFALAYDTTAGPSNLETPVVTVPDFSLIFAVLAALIPVVTFILTNRRRRRLAARVISLAVSLLIALSLLSQDVMTAVAAPDAFYLHQTATGGGSVAHVETQSTGKTIETSYSLPSVAGGTNRLYLISVAIYRDSGSSGAVSSIDGGGLSWSFQVAQCSARISNPRIEVWQAYGSPSSFSATVNLSGGAVRRSSAAISSYSGADPTTPTEGAEGSNYNGQNGACGTGVTDTDAASLSLTSSQDNSVLYVATQPRNRTISTPDPDYTERAFVSNSSGGDGANLYVHDRTLASAGTDSADHTLSGTTDWNMAGLVINPGSGVSPGGESMDSVVGSSPATRTFDTLNQDAYWYSDIAYPTGQDDATIAAGSYTFNAYLSSLPDGSGWYSPSWTFRKQITVQSSQVDANLSDFPVYVDLAGLGSEFFSNVRSDGGDVRVTNSDGVTEMPREVVAIDTALETGELHFRADSLSSAANTSFYIYYGNPGAADYAASDPYGANNVWTTSYAAVWHLQESGNGTADEFADSSANANHGTGQASNPTQVSAQIANGQDFSGAADGITVADAASLRVLGDMSVSFWVNLDGVPTQGVDGSVWKIVGKESPGPGWDAVFVVDVSNFSATPRWTWYHWSSSAGNGDLLEFTNYVVPTLEDHYVTLVRDATAKTVTLYVDGAFVQTLSYVYNPTISAEPVGIGYSPLVGYDHRLDGVLDELRLTSATRAAGWVSTEYSNLSSPGTFYTVASQEVVQSVDLTVSVHHTAADGSDPQLITQVAATINSNTPTTLTLDLGSASPQTFNAGDPRLLRVRIHVDQVSGGASFVLDYDSAADPSSLETPSLTVPDPSVLFAVLAVLIPLLTATLTMKRRTAVRVIGVLISLTVALSMLATQVSTVTAAPDVFYLHDSAAGSGADWYNPDWGYRNKITIDNTKVSGSSNLSYFPVLVNMTEAEWADSTNGGKVDQADGGDILFTASDGTTKLDHEIESYDNTTGALVAWVEVPTVSYNSDTDLYIYYGNTTGVADQWNISGTWDEGGANNYKAVWHMDEEASGVGTTDLYQDSTGNLNHADDQISATGQSGRINGGQQFDGVDDYAPAPDYDVLNAITVEAWINWTALGTSEGILSKRTDNEVAGNWALRGDNSSPGKLEWMVWSGIDSSQSVLTTTTLTGGQWTHVVLTFDDPSNAVEFYLDGASDNTGSITNGLADTPQPIQIGHSGQGSQVFNGYIDEVRISNTIRSAGWIQTGYNNQVSPATFFKPLGGQETSGLSPAGKLMNTTQGSPGATLTFDTVNQEAYWYSELSYPTGGDNATIAAGSYTLNMYFNSLPSGGAFPIAQATNTSNTTTASTSHTVNLPAGVQSGDLLIVMLGGYIGSGATPIDISWPVGWTEFYEEDATSGTSHLAVSGAYRKADGTEGSSVAATTNIAVLASHNAYRISGAADPAIQPPEVATVAFIDQSGTTLDPPSLTPTGGAKDYLWLAVAGWRRTGRTLVSGPAGYSDSIDIQSTGGAEGLHLASARRQLNAASEDPGVFTLSSNSERKIGATIAVHPASSSIDITVSVHHTKQDGSDPQPITSAATTINSGSSDPLALDLGSGAEQTFTAADPRLLRVLVKVDSITGGGSFVLDYDSAANPSSLDTPVVTVPEWGAALLLLVPLVPYLIAAIWRRRRLAGSITSVMLGAIVAISLLASQVTPTTAAPDVFYLHTDPTSGLSPAGEYMDLIEGTGGGLNTGTGADGSVTLSSVGNLNTQILGSSRSGNPDGIVTAVTANPTGSSISVASSTGFAAGDEILLINLQGSLGDVADVGNYEFLEVASVPNSTTIDVTSTIASSYDGTSFANQKVVVQRVPQWTSVTINNGGALLANAWDGTTGGIIAFRATGTVTVNTGGKLEAIGLGYRGGAGGANDGGANGESYDGQNGKGGADGLAGTLGGGSGEDHPTQDNTTGARGGGGGGGQTGSIGEGGAGGAGGGYGGGGGGGGGGSDTDNYISGAGGAGGTTGDSAGGGGHGENSGTSGNGGDAGTPGNDGGASVAVGGGLAGSGATTGQGGHSEDGSDSPGGGGGGGGTYGVADLTQIFFGSGGGGGGDSGAVAGNGETGGAGGGILFVAADTIDNNGTIRASGADGVTATDGDGASGGGAGGSILIHANTVDNATGSLSAAGGAGGARDVNDDAGGGGGGGVGRIRIEADSISGTTTPAASTAGTPGGGSPSKTFNSVGNTYWYHDVAWPTGDDDANIAAGDYTFNMYFGSLPSGSNWYDANWSYRKQITVQSSQVDANLSNFPVYLDLADLGGDFFSNVKADGGDIRVTTSDGVTEVPREVVAIDTGAEAGELHFRADSLTSASNTSFYIYYGNSGASDYAATATYGRNNVWSNGYAAVWHLQEEAGGTGTSGLYVDSTGNGYDGDDQVSATGQTGRLGAGQQLDGSDDFIDMGDVLDFADPADFTLESWIRPSIPSNVTVEGSGSGDVIHSDPTPHTISFNVSCAGTNRLLLVGVSNYPEASGSTPSGVTVNGSSTGVDRLDGSGADMYVNEGGNDAEAYIYKKVAPDTGTNTVEVTFNLDFTDSGAIAGAICLSGVDQTTPLGNWSSNTGNAASPATVTVSSASGELVFSVAAMEKATDLSSDGTDHWAYSVTTNNDTPGAGGSTKAGGTSVTTTWSWSDAGDHWAVGAVPIKPVSSGLSDQMTFIGKWGGTGSDRNYRFEVETDSTLTFLPGGSGTPNLNTTTVLQSDTWYHAAVNVRPGSDSIRLLLNGTQEDSTSTWTGAIGDGTYSFNLGRRSDVSQWFDGYLDEVRVSDVSRGTGWVETSYNNQNSTTGFYQVAGQEAYQSVDITVYVHHTKSDGTDPQLITSASTTITADTADPLAFDLGNDPVGQTFTSADPRVLRLTMEVTGVDGGGSFVLDYDGLCAANACSSLDTPVIVVPELGLIFGAVAALIPIAMGGLWRRRRERNR